MHQGDRSFVELLLIVELVLDQAGIDEVAHIRAGVPSHIVRINVDFSQALDHLILICHIRFRPWSCGGKV
jgi:hypothetical protein